MTIGGNDIGFKSIIEKCVKPGQCTNDTVWVGNTYKDISQLDTTLTSTYRAVWRAANDPQSTAARGGRAAPVIVLGYPRVLPESSAGSCSGFTTSEIAFGNEVVDRLDEKIADAVDAAAAAGADVYFVPTIRSAIPPGNSACSQVPFINSLDLVTGIGAKGSDFLSGAHHTQELMHPNLRGYRAITNVLVQALVTL